MSESIGSAAKGLKPCKRYIATHDVNGRSVYAESPEQVFHAVQDVGGMARSYSVSSVPAILENGADIKAYQAEDGATSFRRREIVLPQPGANLLVVDLEPGGVSMMHRTVSIDFSICCVGEIDHELDSGEKVRLYPGYHIVQRGTNHRWSNPSKDKPARFVACTLPCVPFDIAGQELKEVHVPNTPRSKL
ncbi:Ascochitine biosynthesis cluster protein 2, partial [Pseudocercospora fuligena]